MFRIKTLFGGKSFCCTKTFTSEVNQLKARNFQSQAVEAFVGGVVLNRMTFLGLPDSCPIYFFYSFHPFCWFFSLFLKQRQWKLKFDEATIEHQQLVERLRAFF